jgi:hypothetical protein
VPRTIPAKIALHGYISNFWDMIALQFWQRMLMASAAAGFEAVPDRECC